MRVGLGGELVAVPWSGGQQIGDPERRRDVNGLAHLAAGDQAVHRLDRSLVH